MKKLLISLLVLSLLILTACGNPGPTAALKADLENAKTSPEEIIGEIDEDGFGEKATKALIDKVLEFDYELGEEVIDGETATVETTITTYPFGQIFSNVVTNFITQSFSMSNSMTDEEMNKLMDKLLIEELNKAEKNYTKTIKIQLKQDNGAWVVQEDVQMSNALTGGMLDFANNMSTDN